MTAFLVTAVVTLVLIGLVVAAVAGLTVLGGFLLTRVIEILAPVLLLIWFVLHGRRNGQGWERLAGKRYAHRGLHGPGVPENSLGAFCRAAEAGYGAELDVRLTADGYLAVIHDSDLARMCGVEAKVEDLTAAELGKLRLVGSGEPVPFLEQVVPLFEGRGPLVVELKTAGGNYAVLCEKTLECLDRFRADYCIESFDPRCLMWLRKNRREVLRGQLTQDFLRRGESQPLRNRLALTALLCNGLTRPDFVACRYQDRRMVPLALWRLWGGRTALWTIRSPGELVETERLGALPIFENFDPEEETLHDKR